MWLSGRVNVGRRPGKALQSWIQVIATLSIAGVLGRIAFGRRFWTLTKIADALSFVPVTRTLHLYNQVTTSQVVRYPGRGSVLSQAVLVMEYFCLAVSCADATSKILGMLGWVTSHQLNSHTSPTMQGVYALYTVAIYTRVLCHSILLNVLDEAYTIGSTSCATNDATGGGDNDNNNKSEEEEEEEEGDIENWNTMSDGSRLIRRPFVETDGESTMALVD